MNAILFPGQGSQIVGMGSEFYNKFEIVKKIGRTNKNGSIFLVISTPQPKLSVHNNANKCRLKKRIEANANLFSFISLILLK